MNLTDKRVLLTGDAGFIGSHLAEQLLADENEVVVADDCSDANPEWLPDDIGFVCADLTETAAVVDVVTHPSRLPPHRSRER